MYKYKYMYIWWLGWATYEEVASSDEAGGQRPEDDRRRYRDQRESLLGVCASGLRDSGFNTPGCSV